MKMRTFNCLLLCFVVSLLWACGGGGSGGGVTIHEGRVTGVNTADYNINVCYVGSNICDIADTEGYFELDPVRDLPMVATLTPITRAVTHYELKAPVGSKVISPVTTIAQHRIALNPSLSVEDVIEELGSNDAVINDAIFSAMVVSLDIIGESSADALLVVNDIVSKEIDSVIDDIEAGIKTDEQIAQDAVANVTSNTNAVKDTIAQEADRIEQKIEEAKPKPTYGASTFLETPITVYQVAYAMNNTATLGGMNIDLPGETADVLEYVSFTEGNMPTAVVETVAIFANANGSVEAPNAVYTDVTVNILGNSAYPMGTGDFQFNPAYFPKLSGRTAPAGSLLYEVTTEGGGKMLWFNNVVAEDMLAAMEESGGEPEPGVCESVIPAPGVFPATADWGACFDGDVANGQRLIRYYTDVTETELQGYINELRLNGFTQMSADAIWAWSMGNETFAWGYTESTVFNGESNVPAYAVFWAYEDYSDENLSTDDDYVAWLAARRNGEIGYIPGISTNGTTVIQTEENLIVFFATDDSDANPDNYINGLRGMSYLRDEINDLWYKDVLDDSFIGDVRFEWSYDESLGEFGLVAFKWRVTDIVPSLCGGVLPPNFPVRGEWGNCDANNIQVAGSDRLVISYEDVTLVELQNYANQLEEDGFVRATPDALVWMKTVGNEAHLFGYAAEVSDDYSYSAFWVHEDLTSELTSIDADYATWLSNRGDGEENYIPVAPEGGVTVLQTDETLAVLYVGIGTQDYTDDLIALEYEYGNFPTDGGFYMDVLNDSVLDNKRIEWTYNSSIYGFEIYIYRWSVTTIEP